MAVVLALIAGPLGAWLTTAAYAQAFARLQGTVTDTTGKPYPNVTLTIKGIDSNRTFEVKTDSQGHYLVNGMLGGAYNIDLKVKDQVIYQTSVKITSGTAPVLNVDMAKVAGANAEAAEKRAEAEKEFQSLKAHYDAGLQAIDALKAAQAQLAQTPKDQQAPIQAKIAEVGGTAVTELTAALQLMKPEDPNQSIVLAQLGGAYESTNKWQEAADMYQKSIALKPDVAANYNNLGNDLARLGKVEEAKAAYQKYVDLDPANAAIAWRNLGTVLYQANRMKESIEPLRKSTELDPKNAQGWYLLGVALVNTMEFKTEGDKMTPVIQPGTIEAYQNAINLDPNGPIGAQAKQGLESLQAMGVGGISTKVGQAPAPAKGKK